MSLLSYWLLNFYKSFIYCLLNIFVMEDKFPTPEELYAQGGDYVLSLDNCLNESEGRFVSELGVLESMVVSYVTEVNNTLSSMEGVNGSYLQLVSQIEFTDDGRKVALLNKFSAETVDLSVKEQVEAYFVDQSRKFAELVSPVIKRIEDFDKLSDQYRGAILELTEMNKLNLTPENVEEMFFYIPRGGNVYESRLHVSCGNLAGPFKHDFLLPGNLENPENDFVFPEGVLAYQISNPSRCIELEVLALYSARKGLGKLLSSRLVVMDFDSPNVPLA